MRGYAEILLIYCGINIGLLYHKERILHSAGYDCLGSLYPLWHARAIAYDINGEGSRWLYDPSGKETYENNFYDKADQIVQTASHPNQKAHVLSLMQTPGDKKGFLAG